MNSQELMHSVIQRIATGPDLSKNINFDEAKDAMKAVIRGDIDDVQSAIFLIALRMKRETMEENSGILSAVLSESDQQQVMLMIWLIWVIRIVDTTDQFRYHHFYHLY